MPFDGNKWNFKKMVPYQEMTDTIKAKHPDFCRLSDKPNDTSKVIKNGIFNDCFSATQLFTSLIVII